MSTPSTLPMPGRRHFTLALAACSLPCAASQALVNDATGLNPVPVARILVPRTLDEIATALRTHAGPVSIGGARYSMGGRIAAEGSLHLNMRSFNQVRINGQPGITWRLC